jgi:hypothetical protein
MATPGIRQAALLISRGHVCYAMTHDDERGPLYEERLHRRSCNLRAAHPDG